MFFKQAASQFLFQAPNPAERDNTSNKGRHQVTESGHIQAVKVKTNM